MRFRDLTCTIVPRAILRLSSLALSHRVVYTSPGLLWLMHFAHDPICMHRARKSGTKLNCCYIVPQERTSQVIPTSRQPATPWKVSQTAAHVRRQVKQSACLESAGVLSLFSLSSRALYLVQSVRLFLSSDSWFVELDDSVRLNSSMRFFILFFFSPLRFWNREKKLIFPHCS